MAKIHASVPDDLWEAAQLATMILDPKLTSPGASLVASRGLQALVARAWEHQPEIMDEWLITKKETVSAGIASLVKGRSDKSKVGGPSEPVEATLEASRRPPSSKRRSSRQMSIRVRKRPVEVSPTMPVRPVIHKGGYREVLQAR